MHLKKLELSGFKSFAKPVTLEFPSRITAIVGPNGSGKSNVVEGIRWALGEQSMKTLRGKKGEDLVWNGSPSVPRLGRASVVLVFDNTDGKIPVEFEEVSIGRKIFRDGLGEYTLNGSVVRLKDVVELAARMGLGETKHNIIGQGEVDRMLLSSPRERREMLEEALGLRIHQIKKNEAERKLAATEENVSRAEELLREITPHLKLLRSQAKKAEALEKFESELRAMERIYIAREAQEIAAAEKQLQDVRTPLIEKHREVRLRIEKVSKETAECDAILEKFTKETDEEKELAALETRQRALERELGRLEGKLEMERENAARPHVRLVDLQYVREEIQKFLSDMRTTLEQEDDIETVRAHLFALLEDLEQLLYDIGQGKALKKFEGVSHDALAALEKTIHSLKEEMNRVGEEIEKRTLRKINERSEERGLREKARSLEIVLRTLHEEERDLLLHIERMRFEEDQIAARRRAFDALISQCGMNKDAIASVKLDGYETFSVAELKEKVERLRIKCEEIGKIDPQILEEYAKTETRYTFITNEIDDLTRAAASLKSLVSELDAIIKRDFKEGFSKINEEFNNYFKIIFGGGKTKLELTRATPRATEAVGDGEEIERDAAASETEEGVEIMVDLPRKRVKGIQMLSGGERALVSIALLFSFTAVNPPPFLVLDETDAALDEANSQRYAAILKELAKKTQLILITHNRETMKVAGVLYGVTMGDDGVSRLLSLKLEEAEVYTNR